MCRLKLNMDLGSPTTKNVYHPWGVKTFWGILKTTLPMFIPMMCGLNQCIYILAFTLQPSHLSSFLQSPFLLPFLYSFHHFPSFHLSPKSVSPCSNPPAILLPLEFLPLAFLL